MISLKKFSIDIHDKNPNMWDVSDRDLRLFAELAYGKTETLKSVINEPNANSVKVLENAYDKRTDYQIDFTKELLGKWKILQTYSDGEFLSSGADYTVLGNGEHADGSYDNIVVAFRGTQKTSPADWWADAKIMFGKAPSQVNTFEHLADTILAQYKPKNVYSTGHSLGGYLAQFFAAYTMQETPERQEVFRHSALFNPAKIKVGDNSPTSMKTALYNSEYGEVKPHSYVITGEWVSKGPLFGLFEGLGTYSNSIMFDFKEDALWGRHNLKSFFEQDSEIRHYFTYGYRTDIRYSRYDSDGDGLSDVLERHIGTNPYQADKLGGKDTDGDGFSDYLELKMGTDFLDAKDKPNLDFMIDKQDQSFLAITGTEEANTGKLLTVQAVEMQATVDVDQGKLVYSPVADSELNLPMNQVDWQTWLSSGSQVICGTAEDDTLQGTDASEIIYGGAGDDTIMVGKGGDVLIGGKGTDTFVFTSESLSHQPSLIADFSKEDKLDFKGLRELFADHGQQWNGNDILRETPETSGKSALVWQADQHILSYQAANSTNLSTIVRFDDSVNDAMIRGALIA